MKFIKTFLYNLIVKATRWGRIQTNYKLITQELLTVGKYTYGIETLMLKFRLFADLMENGVKWVAPRL